MSILGFQKNKVISTKKLAFNSLHTLRNYCETEKFEGYDPYDGLNSHLFKSIPFLSKNKWAQIAWIQFFKKSPLNLRPLVGISKGANPKGLALFISGYSILARFPGESSKIIHDRIEELANKLEELISPGFSGACWGYNFDWASRAFFQPKFTPTIVASTFAANAMLDAFEETGNVRWKEIALSTASFIQNDLNRTEDKDGDFSFSYSPFDKTSVFNASLLGARFLARVYGYTKNQSLLDDIRRSVRYCCKNQKPDGSWTYSTLPFHQWIDNFHTGFNLECIYDCIRYTGDNQFDRYFELGVDYYLKTFFLEDGRSKYYNNSIYPIDIHAPSQLMVTLSKTEQFNKYRDIADRVISWTISNMQSPRGYFYYQRSKYYTNKISYMRWSQAWIFYG